MITYHQRKNKNVSNQPVVHSKFAVQADTDPYRPLYRFCMSRSCTDSHPYRSIMTFGPPFHDQMNIEKLKEKKDQKWTDMLYCADNIHYRNTITKTICKSAIFINSQHSSFLFTTFILLKLLHLNYLLVVLSKSKQMKTIYIASEGLNTNE